MLCINVRKFKVFPHPGTGTLRRDGPNLYFIRFIEARSTEQPLWQFWWDDLIRYSISTSARIYWFRPWTTWEFTHEWKALPKSSQVKNIKLRIRGGSRTDSKMLFEHSLMFPRKRHFLGYDWNPNYRKIDDHFPKRRNTYRNIPADIELRQARYGNHPATPELSPSASLERMTGPSTKCARVFVHYTSVTRLGQQLPHLHAMQYIFSHFLGHA